MLDYTEIHDTKTLTSAFLFSKSSKFNFRNLWNDNLTFLKRIPHFVIEETRIVNILK